MAKLSPEDLKFESYYFPKWKHSRYINLTKETMYAYFFYNQSKPVRNINQT